MRRFFHTFAAVKELIRSAIFLAFLVLGFRARRSERAALTFIAFVVGMTFVAGFTQQEAWPFSNWALVHTMRSPEMNRWDLAAIDTQGREWLIDPRVLEPFAAEEYLTWMQMKFMRMDGEKRQRVAADIVRRAEEGRRRFLRTGDPGTIRTILGPLTAARHFHRAPTWRSDADVPRVPFVRFRLVMTSWNVEELARDPKATRRRVLYESR